MQATERHTDVAVVGAGIVGLAHALAAVRRGLRVVLFERSPRAQGASVRNFGMVWPVGQAPAAVHDRALRSRQRWLEVADAAGIWHAPVGSLHVAYRDDEAAVMQEFAEAAPALGYDCTWIGPDETCDRSPAVRRDGLVGALWSPTEVCVDPREAIATLPGWLAEAHGVAVHFATAVVDVTDGRVTTAEGDVWRADRTVVCSGDDFAALLPDVFAESGLVRCKLQMLRSVPQPGGFRIGPMLAGGLTLRHYAAFADCPSLPALRRRVAEETPEFDRWGIHVMASQNGSGEIVIGDSHVYGDDAIDPFDDDRIDTLVLDYLQGFLAVPELTIAARWHGVYAKHPDAAAFVARPADGVRVVTGLGGAGMSTSFGLADEVFDDFDDVA